MRPIEVHAVTGPRSYTGRYIAQRLVQEGIGVRGFVRSGKLGDDNASDDRVLQFDDPERLSTDLEGCSVLYNTYWIRFERGSTTFAQAVRNTGILCAAAARAGVGRIVHLSVSNPSIESPFAYFRGKAEAEDVVAAAQVPFSTVRPTLVFGREDILINNIAWLLRNFRFFVAPGSGKYRVQPVFVGDVANIAVAEARQTGDRTLDAAGPDIMTFNQMLEILRAVVSPRAVMVHAPTSISLALADLTSIGLRDTLVTREELGALEAETLISHQPSTAATNFDGWVNENASRLGGRYTSEIRRHWSA